MASTATYILAAIVVAMAAVGGYIAVYDDLPHPCQGLSY